MIYVKCRKCGNIDTINRAHSCPPPKGLAEFIVWVRHRWDRDPRPEPEKLAIAGMGLMGEAAEVGEPVKKYFVSGKQVDRAELVKELGDVLHYWSYVCSRAGITAQEVIDANVAKLNARYIEGFPPPVTHPQEFVK